MKNLKFVQSISEKMKKSIFLLLLLISSAPLFSQETTSSYDEKLAKSLKADENGINNMFFVY